MADAQQESPRLAHPLGKALTSADYRQRGWKTTSPVHEKQGSMLGPEEGRAPGNQRPRPEVRTWATMGADKQSQVARMAQEKYGLSLENVTHNVGVHIDQGYLKSAAAEKVDPEARTGHEGEAIGQRFYSGDSPEGQIAHRDETAEYARGHDLPFHVVTALRAAVSPRSKVDREIGDVTASIEHVHNKPDAVYDMKQNASTRGSANWVEGAEGLAAQRNAQKAAEMVRQHEQGVHPLDAVDPTGKEERQGVGHRLMHPRRTRKIVSYNEAQQDPHQQGIPRTQQTAVMDTWMLGAAAPHLPKTAPKIGNGKVDPKTGKEYQQPVPQSHPAWAPNQEDAMDEDGMYEFLEEGMRRAATKRGLGLNEAQSVAWHHTRGMMPEPTEPTSGMPAGGMFTKAGNAVPAMKPEGEHKHPAPGAIGRLFNDRRP